MSRCFCHHWLVGGSPAGFLCRPAWPSNCLCAEICSMVSLGIAPTWAAIASLFLALTCSNPGTPRETDRRFARFIPHNCLCFFSLFFSFDLLLGGCCSSGVLRVQLACPSRPTIVRHGHSQHFSEGDFSVCGCTVSIHSGRTISSRVGRMPLTLVDNLWENIYTR